MLFYVKVIALATLFATFADFTKRYKPLSILLFCLSGFAMFVPLAIRGMGGDYQHYLAIYLNSIHTPLAAYHGFPEPFYYLLNYIAYWLFGNFAGVNILCAFLSISLTFIGIYKFRSKIKLGMCVWCFGFIYYMMMYGLNRMAIALAIVFCFCYPSYMKHLKWRYLFWAFVATCFHYSSFLMIPFYFLLEWIEKKQGSFTLIRWFMFILGVLCVFMLIYTLVPILFGGLSFFIRYQKYFTLDFIPQSFNQHAASYFLFLLVLWKHKSLSVFLGEYKILLSMIYIFIVLALGSTVMNIFRICYFFYPASMLLYSAFPMYYNQLPNRNHTNLNNLVYCILIFSMGLLWLYKFLLHEGSWSALLVPYHINTYFY